MYFAKALVSLFALGSVANAFAEDYNDALAAREVDFIHARAEYIEARDNYIMEKRGGGQSKPYKAHQGTCFEKQCKEPFNRSIRVCGSCKGRDGSKCTCTY